MQQNKGNSNTINKTRKRNKMKEKEKSGGPQRSATGF